MTVIKPGQVWVSTTGRALSFSRILIVDSSHHVNNHFIVQDLDEPSYMAQFEDLDITGNYKLDTGYMAGEQFEKDLEELLNKESK